MSAPEVPLLLTMIAIDDVPHAGIEQNAAVAVVLHQIPLETHCLVDTDAGPLFSSVGLRAIRYSIWPQQLAENFYTSYPGLRDCRDVETARFRRTVPGTCPIYWRSSVKDS